MNVLLPENLDLASLPTQSKSSLPYKVSRFKYILGLITERSAFDHRLRSSGALRPFIPLSAKLLNEVIPHYQRYVNELCEVGVLECDPTYIPSKKCKAYRFTEPYDTKMIVCPILYSEDRILFKKNEKFSLERQWKARKRYPKLVNRLTGLCLDKEAALAYTEQDYQTKLTAANTKKQLKKALNEYNTHKAMIERFASPYNICSVDNAGHRLHTKLTNFWSPLRQFVTYRNHPLVSVDLSNSQPFLATTLLQEHFYHHQSVTGLLNIKQLQADLQQRLNCQPSIFSHIETRYGLKTSATPVPIQTKRYEEMSIGEQLELSVKSSQVGMGWYSTLMLDKYGNSADRSTLMLDISDEKQGSSSSLMVDTLMLDISSTESWCKGLSSSYHAELDLFIGSVQEGQFYEMLGEQISQKTGQPAPKRKKLKEWVLSTIYSKNNDTRDFIIEACTIFKSVFPLIFDVFKELKDRAHSDLPILLQGIEAEMFLNRIAGRISRESPRLPIFTIHDSLVTIDGHQDYVQDVMREELFVATGFIPHFKQEKWQV